MTQQGRETFLNSLVNFLQTEFNWEFDKDEFDDRFLLQKYVFFAQRLGYPTDYSYNIYVFGAYSPELSRDYFNEGMEPSESSIDVWDFFDPEEFGAILRGHDAQWLEIASTALLLTDRYGERPQEDVIDIIIEKTAEKKDVSEAYVETVVQSLEESRLID